MGALTFTNKQRPQFIGNQKRVTALATGSSSYATGGETFTPQVFGLSRIDDVICEAAPVAAATSAYVTAWNRSKSAPKVLFYTGAAAGTPLAEETAADNVSTFAFNITVIGV